MCSAVGAGIEKFASVGLARKVAMHARMVVAAEAPFMRRRV